MPWDDSEQRHTSGVSAYARQSEQCMEYLEVAIERYKIGQNVAFSGLLSFLPLSGFPQSLRRLIITASSS